MREGFVSLLTLLIIETFVSKTRVKLHKFTAHKLSLNMNDKKNVLEQLKKQNRRR